MKRWMTIFLLAAAAACAPPLPQPGASPAAGAAGAGGHLLIVGGGRQPDELVQRFVDLAGGAGRARIAVIPMASSQPDESGRGKAEQLREFGADAFALVITRADADRDSVVRLLDGVTGVWFNGGDQSRLMTVLEGSRLLGAIRERYQQGAVIGGTSAGAAVMSDSMITGSQRLADEDTIGYHGDNFPSVARATIEVVPGLAFLPGTLVDQHFLRRERHNRLLSATLERPSMLGVGIDESTALLVRPDGGWEVVGASAVVIYDARDATVTPALAPQLGASSIRMHLLPAGSTFNPATGSASLGR